MKKFGKAFGWTVGQSINMYLVWEGMHGSVPCWNIFRLFAWFFTISYICLSTVKTLATVAEIPSALDIQKAVGSHPVNKYVSFFSDLAIAACLAGFGHIGYAVLIIIQQVAEQT